MTDTKKFTLSKMDKEKAVVTYLNLAVRFENRDAITYKIFSSCWKSLFPVGNYNTSNDTKLKAYKEVCNVLEDMSIEEIEKYRNTVCIFEGSKVPKDILELARTKTQDMKVCLTKNKNKNLSGFDVLIRYNCRDKLRLNTIPFGLSENGVKKLIGSIPIKSVLVDNEKKLMNLLQDENVAESTKRKAVKKYKAPFATQRFRVFMNRFTIRTCKNKQLVNDCVNLCERVHIMNLSNMKPIKYAFCKGSGKRKATMKKLKKH